VKTLYNVRVVTPGNTIAQFGYERPEHAFYAFAQYASRPEQATAGSIVRVEEAEGQPNHTKQLAWFQRD
jgi:hypothetical protein